MIYRHTVEQIKEYHERIGINQSSLKVFNDEGVQAFADQQRDLLSRDDLYYEEKKHFIIGSAVDCKLTHAEDVFDKLYFSSKLTKKPGDKAMSVIRLAFDKALVNFPLGPDMELKLYKKEVYEAANEEQYYMNRAKPTMEEDGRIEYLLKDNGQAYWSDLYLAIGKQILSTEELTIAEGIAMSMKTHSTTRHLFQDSPDSDLVFQLPMYWEYEGIDCKGMIDELYIDHRRKRIMPIDFKTLGDYILKFNKAVRKRRYDLQGSYYSFGLKANLAALSELIGKDVRDYSIANFAFVVGSTIRSSCPVIYPLDDIVLSYGENGNEETGLKGWKQIIHNLKSWVDIDFSIEKRLEDTGGVLFITKDFEYSKVI